MASWWRPLLISSLAMLLRLLFLLLPTAAAEHSWRYLAHATSTLTAVDFRSGGSCSEASSCRREVVSSRATILGHPLDSDDCEIAYRSAGDYFNKNDTYGFTLGVLHYCEDIEGRVFSQGEGVCTYEVCAMFSWAKNGTLDYEVIVTHEGGRGENETRTVSVDVYLNYDDGTDTTSLGDMMCLPNRTCKDYTECGGDSAEVMVVAHDSHGDGWIDPFGNTTDSAYWKLKGAEKEWTGTVFADHVAVGSRLCLNKGDYDFTCPGNAAWPNDLSWNLCNKEGFAGEALAITVEDGRCMPMGDVVTVAPQFLEPPGAGSDSMCETCTEYSSQLGSQIGVYYESACDPDIYTNNDGFLNSGGGSGCVVRDYFDDAGVTCRFCIVNRELWREENPGARDPDWPDCPCCVADYLNVSCVTLDAVVASDASILGSSRDQHIMIIALSCAVGVALCVILGCLCCIVRDIKKKESKHVTSSKQAVSHRERSSATMDFFATLELSKESPTRSERGALPTLYSRDSSRNQAAVRGAAVRGVGGGGSGSGSRGLATSYSDSSINGNKRKRVEFDAAQAMAIGIVKGERKSKSSRDLRNVAPDPEFRFDMSLLTEEDAESSMAEASNPMFDPMHRAIREPEPVPLSSGRHQQNQDQNRNRQQQQQQKKKQAPRKQRPYDEDYARLEEGMGTIPGDVDVPVSPPRGPGLRPKQKVQVKVYKSRIPLRLHAARGGATVVTRRTSNRLRDKHASPEDSTSKGEVTAAAASVASTEAMDRASSPGPSISHLRLKSYMQNEDGKAYSSEMSLSSLSDSGIIEENSSIVRERRDIDASSSVLSVDQDVRNDNGGGDDKLERHGQEEVLPSSETGSVKTNTFATPTRSHGRPPSSVDGHSEHSGRGFSFPRPWIFPNGKSPGDGDGGGGGSAGVPVPSTPTERGRLSGVGRRYRRALSSGSEASGNGGERKRGGGTSSGSGSGSGGSHQRQRYEEQRQRKRRASFSESPFRVPRESLRAAGRGIMMRSSPLHQRMQVGPRRSSPPEATVASAEGQRGREMGRTRSIPDPRSGEGEGKGDEENDSVGMGSTGGKSRFRGSGTSSGRSGSDPRSRSRRRGQDGETSSSRRRSADDLGGRVRSGSSRRSSLPLMVPTGREEKGDGDDRASVTVTAAETLVEEKESFVVRAPKRSKSRQSIDSSNAATTTRAGVTFAGKVTANADGTDESTVFPPRPPLERSKRSRSIGDANSLRARPMRSLSPGASIVVPRVEASTGVARPSARLRDHVAGRVKSSESMKRGATGRSQSAVPVLDLRRSSLNGTRGESNFVVTGYSAANVGNDPPLSGPTSMSIASQAAPTADREETKGRTEPRPESRSSGGKVQPSGDRAVKESAGGIDEDGKRAVSWATQPRSAPTRKEGGASASGIDGPEADSDGSMLWENALRKSIPIMLQRASSKVSDSTHDSKKRQSRDSSPRSSLNGHKRSAASDSAGNGHEEPMTAAASASSSSSSPLKEWLLRKQRREISDNRNQRNGRAARGTSQPDANKSSGSTTSSGSITSSGGGSTSSSEENDGPREETRAVAADATESFDSEEEGGVTTDAADAETVQHRQTARSRIRELSYQSARSRSRGSCQSLSSLTRVVEVSEESESSSETFDSSEASDSFEKTFVNAGSRPDAGETSEPVTMAPLEQQKPKQKEKFGGSCSIQGNAPASPSKLREEPILPSHMHTPSSLSRRFSRSRRRGTEARGRAEHASDGAHSASAPVPGTALDAALAARRAVSTSTAPKMLPRQGSTPGKAETEAAATKETREMPVGVDEKPGNGRSGGGFSSSSVRDRLVEMPSLTEDASRAAEEALNIPTMFTPSTVAAAVAAAAAVAVSDSDEVLSGDDVSRTSLGSSAPTEAQSVDTKLNVNVGSESGRSLSLGHSRLGGGSEASSVGRSEPDYENQYNDADDDSSYDADTWSDFTGRSSGGGSGRTTRSVTPLSVGDSIASSAAAYQSARGSRGSTRTPGRGGWREQARIRKAMVLAAQKAQEALQAGKGLSKGSERKDEGSDDGFSTPGRPHRREVSVASMTPGSAGQVRDGGRGREHGRGRSGGTRAYTTPRGEEEADVERKRGDGASRGGSVEGDENVLVNTGKSERRKERSRATSAKAEEVARSVSGSSYSASSRSLGGSDVYERGPRGRTGPRGHVLAGRSNSRSHLPSADGLNSLTSNFESLSVNSSVTSSEMTSVASSSGGGRNGRPPRASSVSSSLEGRTRRSRSRSGSRSCEGDHHVRERSSRQSRYGPRRGHRLSEGIAGASAVGSDRNEAFLLDVDSPRKPQSGGEPSAESVTSAASLFRSRSQLTELRQQREKDKAKHAHHGYRRRASASVDRRSVPSTSSGSSTGRSSSWSIEAVHRSGLKHPDRGNQAPLHEHYAESSAIIDGSNGGGTANTLAKSMDVKGYYGFLRPAEDRSQGSMEETKT